VDVRTVDDLLIDPTRKTYDYTTAEASMNSGDFEAAIDRFEKVRKDPRATEVVKQTAAINIVRCQWKKGNLSGVLAAVQSLRAQKADGFYLRESYETEIQAFLEMKNLNGAQQAIDAFKAKGNAESMTEWAKTSEIMSADLLERQGKHREALVLYTKHVRDPEVAEHATLGEFRCLAVLQNWPQLNSRSDSVINDAKTKKSVSPRVLTAAFNGRGEVLLNGGKNKEALFDFMQGTLSIEKVGPSREHALSLGRGALACARLAAAEKDKLKKDLYRSRAQELLGELDKTYPKSPIRDEASKAIQEVK
jgi:outer membrane protein assembly factor BamD (BamD/ComL family)